MTEQHANVLRDMRAKVRAVADMYEISPDEVARIWLGQTGQKPAKPAQQAPADTRRALACALKRRGLSVRQIATETGIPTSTVGRWVKIAQAEGERA